VRTRPICAPASAARSGSASATATRSKTVDLVDRLEVVFADATAPHERYPEILPELTR
jgi:hypothetical protein